MLLAFVDIVSRGPWIIVCIMETRIYSGRCDDPTCQQVCVQCRGRILQRTQNGLCQVLRFFQMSTFVNVGLEAKMCWNWSRLFLLTNLFETFRNQLQVPREINWTVCDLWLVSQRTHFWVRSHHAHGLGSDSSSCQRSYLESPGLSHHDLQMDGPLKNHMMVMSQEYYYMNIYDSYYFMIWHL